MCFRNNILMMPLLGIFGFISCAGGGQEQSNGQLSEYQSYMEESKQKELEVATFGAGCFWCVEAVFQSLKGVDTVVSGYSGGHVKNPSYREVCTGNTGHAEVTQIHFDPEVISFKELLEVFWQTHDPTTLNKQGADVGTQYRSAVFYHSGEQKATAEKYKKRLDESGAFGDPVVTEISQFETFYPADDSHQNYYRKNPDQGYCQMVVRPKVEKFKKAFSDKLKEGYK